MNLFLLLICLMLSTSLFWALKPLKELISLPPLQLGGGRPRGIARGIPRGIGGSDLHPRPVILKSEKSRQQEPYTLIFRM